MTLTFSGLTLAAKPLYWELQPRRFILSEDSDAPQKLAYSDQMRKLRSRDAQFLMQLFENSNPVLFKVLATQNIFGELAEDLVQQTWEKFFANFEQFEGRSELQTFICGILFNKVREERKRSKKVVLEEDSEKIFSQTFTSDGWWARPPANPSDLVQTKELSAFLEECLEGLTEQQKSAFVLREVHQEESDEICKLLDVTSANLRVLLFRAKDKLKACLGGHA